MKDTAYPVYWSSLWEVRELVGTFPERRRLWDQLEAFLQASEVERHFSHLYITGPFVSSNQEPREVDAVLRTHASYGPAAFAALKPLFEMGLSHIRRHYGVRLRFWIDGAPRAFCELRRPEGDGTILLSPEEESGLLAHGVVCIRLDGAGDRR